MTFSSDKGDTRIGKPSRTMLLGGEHSGPTMNFSNATQQLNRSLSPPPLPVLSMSDKATKMELEAILRKPAHTPEEKYSLCLFVCLFDLVGYSLEMEIKLN